ncbi:hypothetical protein [Terrabacter sp. C0L_2]|uniref:hypothetical protein n=1 Tax=Terrabacter sp. C0L_2 TaxID=3108389 RepID=UPI002ED45ADE|nr:hypothetical protein U5C87_17560 [Terrabacter sp. C0L_2]
MGNWEVSEAKYVTCICGKVCKGRAAHANHGRKCEMESARSWAFIRATELGMKPVSDGTFKAAWEGGWRPNMKR